MSFSVLGTFLALLQVLSLHQYLYIQLLERTPTTRISNLLILSYEILFLQYCFYKILDFFQLYFSCFPYGKISIHLPSSSLIPLCHLHSTAKPSQWMSCFQGHYFGFKCPSSWSARVLFFCWGTGWFSIHLKTGEWIQELPQPDLSHPRVGSAELPFSFNIVGLCLGFFF